MDRMCTRCARLKLKSGARVQHTLALRSFSTSIRQNEDSNKSPSPNPNPPPNLIRATRPPRTFNATRPFVPGQQSGNSSTQPSSTQRPAGRQILQRTRDPKQGQQRQGRGQPSNRDQGGDAKNAILVKVRYADGSEAEVPAQQLLRPGRGFREPEAVLGTRQQLVDEINGVEGSNEQPQESEEVIANGVEKEPTDAEIDEYISKHIDRPANPTEPIAYEPSVQSTSELQKDWPNTPLSSTGLTATLIQKMEFLARRIPHGYQTPEQIAAHFEKGNLTRFESEEEKEQVLKLATALAQKRAEKLTERKGEQVAAADMTLSDLSNAGDDVKTVVASIVRGDYGNAEKQRMPFLDSIVRNLRNNSTYHQPEMAKFMAKVESLIPAQAGTRKAAPKQARQ